MRNQEEDARAHAERWQLGELIVRVSQECREGYRRGINDFDTVAAQEAQEKCAIAASNTGYFILQALGFSSDEIKRLTHPSAGG